jgi:hypothetical protein
VIRQLLEVAAVSSSDVDPVSHAAGGEGTHQIVGEEIVRRPQLDPADGIEALPMEDLALAHEIVERTHHALAMIASRVGVVARGRIGVLRGQDDAVREVHVERGVSAERSEGRAELFGEELRLLPGREVSAPVDLVEVDEVAIGAPGPRLRGAIALPGEDGDGHGSAISVVLSPAERAGLRPPARPSQYSRADEVAVFVSQYSVTSSSTSSGDFSGSLRLYVHREKPGCPSIHAARPAGESDTP